MTSEEGRGPLDEERDASTAPEAASGGTTPADPVDSGEATDATGATGAADADEAALEAADLLDHEEEPLEVVTREDMVLADAFTAAAMQVDLPSAAPEPERGPGRLEALLGGLVGRLPALSLPVHLEAVVLTVLVGLGSVAFVLIEPTPRWLALLVAIVAALGTDGVLRVADREQFEGGGDTTPYLFLPTLFALTTPVFIEYNVTGFWVIGAALAGAVAFRGVVVAEVASLRVTEPLRVPARFYAAAATYFVVFALFSLAYAFDLGLVEAVLAVALISVLLAVELLRDDQLDAVETLVMAGVVGVIVGEARWVLQYMPIDGFLAGLTLLLLFYFVTGVAHAYIVRQLDRTVAAEYGAVALVGIALVVGVRLAGVA